MAHALLEPVLGLAVEAGERIREVYARDFDVAEKEDRSPLTEADMAAHETILAGLRRLSPELPVLSEESAEIPYAERARWERYWLVDPLDGTREFIKRNGEFTVNIALVEAGRPVLGVIHVPVSGVSYFACAGGGAFRQDPGGEARAIHVRPWDGGRLVVAGSRSHPSPQLMRFVALFPEHEVVSMGSSLKSCLVAEGRADVYVRFGPTSEWDTAAAQCVVEEAGGGLCDFELRPLRYNTKPSLINPPFIVCGDLRHDWRRWLRAAQEGHQQEGDQQEGDQQEGNQGGAGPGRG
ncbi:MAG: 3'(2'),5'-bisphosphate nucleotidase [Gammaproteobacteria bacterium]|nr:MAG: 3'(2'),5'-bisphosphate nucleotidase [Gammaproteobacteria bacterium]